jgi:RecB family exonuclease
MSLQIDIREVGELSEVEKLALQNFSYSRLNTYDWCPAQYFFNYILKYPQEYGAKALLGNVVHKALEITLRNGEVIDKAELLDNYRAAREEYDPDYTIIDDELYALGIDMLERHVEGQAGAPTVITTAELDFEFVFAGVLFRGYIDKVVVTDTEVIIDDYKTGKFEVSNKDIPSNLQLGIYALYLKYLYPDKQVTAALMYMQSEKRKKHTFTDEDFVEVQNRLYEAVDQVRETNNFLPTRAKWKCKICSYAKDGSCGTGRKVLKDTNKAVRYESEF